MCHGKLKHVKQAWNIKWFYTNEAKWANAFKTQEKNHRKYKTKILIWLLTLIWEVDSSSKHNQHHERYKSETESHTSKETFTLGIRGFSANDFLNNIPVSYYYSFQYFLWFSINILYLSLLCVCFLFLRRLKFLFFHMKVWFNFFSFASLSLFFRSNRFI